MTVAAPMYRVLSLQVRIVGIFHPKTHVESRTNMNRNSDKVIECSLVVQLTGKWKPEEGSVGNQTRS